MWRVPQRYGEQPRHRQRRLAQEVVDPLSNWCRHPGWVLEWGQWIIGLFFSKKMRWGTGIDKPIMASCTHGASAHFLVNSSNTEYVIKKIDTKHLHKPPDIKTILIGMCKNRQRLASLLANHRVHDGLRDGQNGRVPGLDRHGLDGVRRWGRRR